MKLVCDCGNEEEFNTIDPETGKETENIEDEGQFARIKEFEICKESYHVYIACKKCGKAIWVFA